MNKSFSSSLLPRRTFCAWQVRSGSKCVQHNLKYTRKVEVCAGIASDGKGDRHSAGLTLRAGL
eukprot:850027-Pleurochrysis_carterae.AAC.2